jgi:hypothetical protein
MADKVKGLLPDDMNGKLASCWRRFSTSKHTITTADTWEEIAVPDAAYEVVLQSVNEFAVGENSSAEGYNSVEMQLGVAGMKSIYVKGSYNGQEIKLLWGLL